MNFDHFRYGGFQEILNDPVCGRFSFQTSLADGHYYLIILPSGPAGESIHQAALSLRLPSFLAHLKDSATLPKVYDAGIEMWWTSRMWERVFCWRDRS